MKSFLLFLCSMFFISINVYAGPPNLMVVATTEGTIVRDRPTDSGKKISKLDVGDRVFFMTDESPNFQVGWRKVQISICMRDRCPSGWVRDEDLADESRFKPMSSWKKSAFSNLETYENGTFQYTYFLDHECNSCPPEYHHYYQDGKRTCAIKGKLYRYRDLVLAKEATQYFFIKNDQLCSVYLYLRENAAHCAK